MHSRGGFDMRQSALAWIAAVLTLAMLLCLAACSGGPSTPPAQPPASGSDSQPITRDMAAAAPSPPSGQPADAPAALPPVIYVSASGERLTAVFDNAAGTVRVTLPGGRQVTLPQAVSGSGARYSDGKETFWEHHGDGTYSVGDQVVFEGKAVENE
jgi:membrane-bound inhibitor of C-type lysozyme